MSTICRISRVVVLTAVLTAAAAPSLAATLVVANKAEATVSLIDLDSGKVVSTLPTGVGPHEVGISPDGAWALVTNYGQRDAPGSSLTLIDIVAAKVAKTIDLGKYRRPHGVEWLPNGRHAVVTAEDNNALLKVHVGDGKVVSAIATDQDISHMVALGGGRAYLANIGSGSMTVIDLDRGERVTNVPTGDGAEGVAVAAGGRQIWVTNRAADTVTVFDAATLEPLVDLESKGFPIRATATPNGLVLVTRARAGDMMVYDTDDVGAGRRVEFDLETSGFDGRLFGDRFGDSSVPIGVIVDDDGGRAYVAHANADVITEVDIARGEIARLLKAGREPDGMGYSALAVTVAP